MHGVPPDRWIAFQLAHYEAELRGSLRDALASESTRKGAELQIADALAHRRRELVAWEKQLGTLPVLLFRSRR